MGGIWSSTEHHIQNLGETLEPENKDNHPHPHEFSDYQESIHPQHNPGMVPQVMLTNPVPKVGLIISKQFH